PGDERRALDLDRARGGRGTHGRDGDQPHRRPPPRRAQPSHSGARAALGRDPLLVFAIYPYLKRWTSLCHFGVGLALALAPLAGYAAAHPDLAHPGPALTL